MPVQHGASLEFSALESNGPDVGYLTTTRNGAFVTTETWWDDEGQTRKVVQRNWTYDGLWRVSQIDFFVFNADGVSVLRQFTEKISYDGIFETARVRG